MAETVELSAAVEALLAPLDANRQRDARALVTLLGDVTGEPPMPSGSIIGFGSYHYKYESGREGDSFLAGFAARKSAFVLYLSDGASTAERAELLARLGKHEAGKGCIYIKKLADIDVAVLRQLTELSVAELRRLYPVA